MPPHVRLSHQGLRVLRAFLPCATPRQTGLLFDGLSALLCEGDDPSTLLRFTAGEQGARRESVALLRGESDVG